MEAFVNMIFMANSQYSAESLCEYSPPGAEKMLQKPHPQGQVYWSNPAKFQEKQHCEAIKYWEPLISEYFSFTD